MTVPNASDTVCATLALSGGLLLLVSGGCSGDPRLSGQVTLDGKPLSKGQLTFVAEGLPTAYATTDDRGWYTAKVGSSSSLQPGTYKVGVSAFELLPSVNKFAPPPQRLITPEKYKSPEQSGLFVDVKRGRNVHDFSLKSDGR